MGGASQKKKDYMTEKYGEDFSKRSTTNFDTSFGQAGFLGFGDERASSIDEAMDKQDTPWARKEREAFAVGKKSLLTSGEGGVIQDPLKKKKTILN